MSKHANVRHLIASLFIPPKTYAYLGRYFAFDTKYIENSDKLPYHISMLETW